MVTNTGLVYFERAGELTKAGFTLDQEDIQIAVQAIAQLDHKEINETHPRLDMRLPDGSRVAALACPASLNGWTLTIRRFTGWYSVPQLIEAGTLPESYADILAQALDNHANILIAGGTSAGKSTLLNALLGLVPLEERLILIEKPAELQPPHQNICRWEATESLTIGHLVEHAMRHRPDRIIVGEVKDPSAYALLQALNSGHSGAISTIHADSADLALTRLSGLATGALPNLNHEFIRMETAAAIHFVAHMKRKNGKRLVSELLRVTGYDNATHRFLTEPIPEKDLHPCHPLPQKR